jgi:hypothetical protein
MDSTKSPHIPEDTLSLNLNSLRDLPAISSPLETPADQHATNSSLAHTLTATSLETMSGLSDVVVAPLPQFTSPEADLVLVTSDGQEFRVFSRFLIETSGVFRDLLDLPTSPNSSERIMTISETARTLNLLLQYIYPMAHPVLASLSDIQTVLLAADKYDVSFITDDLRAKLVSPAVLGTSPIKAYAVACRLGMHEEALKAAQETFSLDFAEKDLEGDRDIRLRTHDAFALFRFQKNRVNAVINVLLATPKPINCEGWFNYLLVPLVNMINATRQVAPLDISMAAPHGKRHILNDVQWYCNALAWFKQIVWDFSILKSFSMPPSSRPAGARNASPALRVTRNSWTGG